MNMKMKMVIGGICVLFLVVVWSFSSVGGSSIPTSVSEKNYFATYIDPIVNETTFITDLKIGDFFESNGMICINDRKNNVVLFLPKTANFVIQSTQK